MSGQPGIIYFSEKLFGFLKNYRGLMEHTESESKSEVYSLHNTILFI